MKKHAWILLYAALCGCFTEAVNAADYTSFTGDKTYTSADTFADPMTMTSGAIARFTGNVTMASNITMNGMLSVFAEGNATFSGNLTGTGTGTLIVRPGAGKLTLTGTNSWATETCVYGWVCIDGNSSLSPVAASHFYLQGGVVEVLAGKNVTISSPEVKLVKWAGAANGAFLVNSGSTLTVSSKINDNPASRASVANRLYVGQTANAGTLVLANSENAYRGGTYIGYALGAKASGDYTALGDGHRDDSKAAAANTAHVKLGANDALGSGIVSFFTGTNSPTSSGNFTLDLNGFSESDVAGLEGFGTVQNTSATAAATLTLNVAEGASYDFSGKFTGGTQGMTLRKTGAGTQTLSGSETSTGLTVNVLGGTLNLAKTGTASAVGNLTIGAGTVNITGNGTNQIADTAALTMTAGSTLNLGGHSETIATVANATTGTINNGTLVLTGAQRLDGAIAGTGKLKFTGDGQRVDFRAGNTYSGGTELAGNGMAVWITDNSTSGGAAFTPFGEGMISVTKSTSAAAGTASVVNLKNLGYGNDIHVANAISLASETVLNVQLTTDSAVNSIELSGPISGAGKLTASLAASGAASFLKLSGTNTFTGGFEINATQVVAGAADALGDGLLTVNGTLKLNGFSDSGVTGLAGSGTIVNDSTSAASALALNLASDSTFSGTLNGGTKGIDLTKTGSGKLVLSGSTANTNANLTVNGGSADLGKTAGSAVNHLTIASGATVNFTTNYGNEILGSVTMNGGTLNLNGVMETVTILKGTEAAVNNGTLAMYSKDDNTVISGSGKMVFNTTGRINFRVASSYTGGTEFIADTDMSGVDNGFWLNGNPFGSGLVTISGNTAFNNFGFGNMVALGNRFEIHDGKTLTLNLRDGGAGAHGFTLSDKLSGNGTLRIIGAANNTVVLSGASAFNGTIAQNAGTLYADSGSFGTLTVSKGTFSPGTAANNIGEITLTSASTSGTTGAGKLLIDVRDDAGVLTYDTLSFTNDAPSFDLADGSLLLNFMNFDVNENTLLDINFLKGLNLAAGDYSSWLDTQLAGFHLISDGAGTLTLSAAAALPEPAGWLLLLAGTACAVLFRKRTHISSSLLSRSK